MLAGAAEVTVKSRSLLFAMGRTDAAVHVENDHLRWTAVMNTVDPCPAQVGQGFNVYVSRQKLCLKTPHLAGGRSLSFDGLATNNPPHAGITSETVGVVHVFISTKATKHRLTELSRYAVPSVLTGTVVLENIPGNLGEAKSIVKLTISEQPVVRGDLGTMGFKLQAAVKINPKAVPFRFTHRVRRKRLGNPPYLNASLSTTVRA